ncbi:MULTISPECIES: TrkH family potassium uptake protein [Peptostreptococcus]|jgi:trk system potassium uptake protein TrkH|uniref:Potassium uptake protein, TrkH family n=1 Tax=Peptostreptococcus anaerobius TaxID=1261 RepID=A0A135YVU7_9FIRM|nr:MULTISPECIES: TrkH family potassium uptake protein [Peptostreptococcus]KXI13471.1 potassium uptake protein, TrkH family [Peptostreptococcus anaerobius]MCB6982663.1 TrkH family potassium uptake protein [Peptostreptococcus anaerobius]MCQ5150723.1 TrkH family potassium uptake protein [Peptostreptococcus anaerobius]MDB8821108.1 TrkH family potassium uptake protein [Peptostreptococcus anaerobius]MDB8825586.1 TrkH family potassium uptake protein [Peptostreptococcus anaerobius]
MNYEMMLFVIMNIARVEGALMLLPALVALIYGENTVAGKILIIAVLCICLGSVFSRKRPKRSDIFVKDGLMIVGLAWVMFSLLGALPFYFTGAIPRFVDAFFETVSGFTTTGSTILTDIESLPYGIHFWRAFTHWVGGMGVLVFVMAVIPLAGSKSLNIMKAEVPGPTMDKIVPKTRQTAKILYLIYVVMTVAEVVLLVLGGMPLFDALIHTFSTAGTGGFSNKADSVSFYDSAYIDGVITVFMALFGVNFNLFYLLLLGKFARVFKSEELRTYIGIIAVATLLITINIYPMYGSFLTSFRYSSFQVTTIITTTGMMTTDFNLWPSFSKGILLMLMFVGACAGSTGGGLKVSRVLLLGKYIKSEIRKIVHPRSIVSVKVDGKVMDDTVIRSVTAYIMIYMSILVVSYLMISLNELDLETTLTSVITCINNVGPGFGEIIGPTQNFSTLSDFSKLVLTLDMLIGRLEIYPILFIFSPRMFKRRF